jgi:hypothetical protein
MRYMLKRMKKKPSNKYVCTTFIAALFTIVKRMKICKCLSMDEWISKV